MFPAILYALEPKFSFGKKGDRGFWFLIFLFPMKKSLLRAASALAAAFRAFRAG